MRLRALKVVEDGKVVKTDKVEPGAPLLRSRYQWRARYRRHMMMDLVGYAFVLIVLMSVVVAILYVAIPDIRLGILVLVLVIAAVLIPEVWAKGFYDPDNPPGLYKEGLVHPKGFFVPYGELREVDVLYPTIPLMPAKISLVPYFEQPSEDYTEWYLHVHVLGEKGVEKLRSQVAEINEELGV
ncbi:MAG: hypothetical protein JSW25_03815 [Thermoplasmata archaeon]|nr:MAG: hypothetical protein JSW25_03815 [Thermoplasmata archaeon]